MRSAEFIPHTTTKLILRHSFINLTFLRTLLITKTAERYIIQFNDSITFKVLLLLKLKILIRIFFISLFFYNIQVIQFDVQLRILSRYSDRCLILVHLLFYIRIML